MTSGVFRNIPLDDIITNDDDRQRQELDGTSKGLKDESLKGIANRIKRRGLIHPLLITRDFVLVCGGRRLAVLKMLGWTHAPCQFQDEVDEEALIEIEFDENYARKDLTWQEKARAIEKLHRIKAAKDPAWSHGKTAEIAGFDRTYVQEILQVAVHINDPEIASQPTHSGASRIIRARRQYAEAAALETLTSYGTIRVARPHDHTILNTPFEDWVNSYDGPGFNLIHCDFPYGIGFDRMGSQAGSSLGRYRDDPDIYVSLLQLFCTALDKFADSSCHLVFWFSIQNYQFTYDMLTERAGFRIDPFPLIWYKSDNSGILPDPRRGPRRVYETAFFGRRGDRPIHSPRSNLCPWPSPSEGAIHPMKPQGMLEHFFSMFISEHTAIFDPTCGSGSALRAAKALGAQRFLGLEADERFATLANFALQEQEQARAQRPNQSVPLQEPLRG